MADWYTINHLTVVLSLFRALLRIASLPAQPPKSGRAAVFRSSRSALSYASLLAVTLSLSGCISNWGIGPKAKRIENAQLVTDQAIRKAALKASKDGSTVGEIQAAFDRAGAIDNISSISGKDLEITKRGDKTIVSLKYSREIELAGPAFLVYRFQYQTN